MDRLRELSLFVAISESASLAAAGRRNGLSPPGVTRVLHELESRLGVRLVERTTRQVALTEAGRRLAEWSACDIMLPVAVLIPIRLPRDRPGLPEPGSRMKARGSRSMIGTFGEGHV